MSANEPCNRNVSRFAATGQGPARIVLTAALAFSLLGPLWAHSTEAQPAAAQQPQSAPSSFGLDILRGAILDSQAGKPAANTTTVPRQAAPPAGAVQAAGTGQLTLVALITEDGQPINQGLVWRVYQATGADGQPKLVATYQVAAPAVQLAAGDYYINAAFGRANLTRKVSIAAGATISEQFALNVGLLRVRALDGAKQPLSPGAVSFDVFSDERNKFGEPSRVITNGKPGTLLRLNSGLYHLDSRYGDANASIQADLTVEPGKLTEATVIHHAARVTFRLVARPGGEATPDTQWSVLNREGDIVKESAGAFPSHMLAPGTYTVTARSHGRVFRQPFTVRSGQTAQVEVLIR